MKPLLFLREFLKNPTSVGAILPSSPFLAEQMVKDVDFNKANVIVELGPGTGVFTDIILKKRNPNTKVMLIENDKRFYSLLKRKYKDKENLFIMNGSAENMDCYAEAYGFNGVDYIISGLPFTSLPKPVSDDILNKTKRMLGENGRFITFQYTLYKKAYFKKHFKKVDIKREFRNVPPAYILSCGN